MSHNPNTVKSQDDTTEDELGRTMTLLRAIEQLEKTECKLEKVEKQLDKVKKERDTYYKALMQIQYKTPALGGGTADMETALCQIDNICDWALRPDEMKEMEKNNGI